MAWPRSPEMREQMYGLAISDWNNGADVQLRATQENSDRQNALRKPIHHDHLRHEGGKRHRCGRRPASGGYIVKPLSAEKFKAEIEEAFAK
jgi:hypothetical protein